jgi:YD repeat-containing protein
VELRTRINGTVRRTSFYLGSDLAAGIGRRVVAAYDASSDSTGIYSYSLELTSFYGTSRLDATPLTGQLAVVNRGNTAYGAGWWLAGLEQLMVQADSSRLWIGGDGSTRRYAKVATNTYVAPALDFPDTLRWDPANSRYERRERGGVRVRYNAQGNHTSTLNRLGHTTSFTYLATGSNPRLDRLTLPVPAGGPTTEYVFTYSASNRLSAVAAPPIGPVPRPTAFSINASNQLQSITDPDTSVVQFGYDATYFRRVASRTDRRNVVTTFAFDSAHNVSLGRLTMEAGKPPIPITIRSLAIQGFGSLPGAVNRAADTSLVYVLHDGPRPISDVGDTTRFYLDRYGAPKRIIDALGNATRLTRANAQFPTLVTSLQRANGHVLNATYDARGNLSLSIDVGGNTAGVPDTARYVWDQTWDALQRVVPQMKDSIIFTIDAANGNRLSQKFIPAAPLFTFSYHGATGLIATTKSPAVSQPDSVLTTCSWAICPAQRRPKGT